MQEERRPEKARNERARAQMLRVFWDSAVMYRGPRVERSFQLRYLHTFAVWNFHSVEGAQSPESYLRFASIRVFFAGGFFMTRRNNFDGVGFMAGLLRYRKNW